LRRLHEIFVDVVVRRVRQSRRERHLVFSSSELVVEKGVVVAVGDDDACAVD
jgi:hypothetical protein